MSRTQLEQLAQLAGVYSGYHDIWGTWQAVTPDIARALLDAMHIPANSDEETEASLRALQARDWDRSLPRVLVVRRDALRTHPFTVPLVLDDEDRSGTWIWTIDEEDGTHRSGRFQPAHLDVEDRHHEGTRRRVRMRLTIEGPLDLGYHTLRVHREDGAGGPPVETTVIVTPATCWIPPEIQDGRRFLGLALQLYTLRSDRNWGIGDFTDLKDLAAPAAAQGVSVLGLNPLHSLLLTNPEDASPYSPSSRLYLNLLYLDVEAIPEFDESGISGQVRSSEFQEQLRALRATEFVDYRAVAQIKRDALEKLFEVFLSRHWGRGTDRDAAFRAFLEEGGTDLRRQAMFDAMQEHFHRQDPSCWGWPVWPDAYRHPGSQEVERWSAESERRVLFFSYLQWQADEQLAEAAAACSRAGMEVGIYRDLAVSVNRAGAEAWSNQEIYAEGVSVGAPPDPFALNGQDWGIPPYIPDALRESAYRPFIHTLRQNMRHSGALRIDHVMALLRLYWIAPGRSAREGAYVGYPFEDLLGILALESRRHRCMVVGEDLGTVPDEVRDALRAHGVLSYKLLYFERRADEEFKDPLEISAQSLASVTTQDLPTWTGWWTGHDLEVKTSLGQFPSAEVARRVAEERGGDRRRILRALGREGLLPPGVSADQDPYFVSPSLELRVNVHRYLARSPAWVMLVVPEDLLAMTDQTNLPGTVHEHPNWSRKLTADLAGLLLGAEASALLAGIRQERGTAS